MWHAARKSDELPKKQSFLFCTDVHRSAQACLRAVHYTPPYGHPQHLTLALCCSAFFYFRLICDACLCAYLFTGCREFVSLPLCYPLLRLLILSRTVMLC
jgi:hypothetical protein